MLIYRKLLIARRGGDGMIRAGGGERNLLIGQITKTDFCYDHDVKLTLFTVLNRLIGGKCYAS